MDTTASPPTRAKSRLHPLVATAAIAVTIFSIAGVAAITGWLPTGKAASGEQAAPVATANTAAPAPAQVAAPAATPVEEHTPKPVVKTAAKPAAQPASVEVAQAPAPAPAAAPVCGNCGAVERIRPISQPGEGSGLGAVAGGVVGAIVGHQIGGGTGRKLATVAGAAGGAYAGHQIEKSQRQKTQYEVVVRMDDGSRRTVMLNMVPGWQVGERVRIEHGTLVRENE